MSIYMTAQVMGTLAAPLIGGYMYTGLNDWRPIFWFSFGWSVATFVICLFCMEETNFQRTQVSVSNLSMVERPSTPPPDFDTGYMGADSGKKNQFEEQFIEVVEVGPLPNVANPSHDATQFRDENAQVVHQDADRPIAKRVSLKRIMRFAKPQANAWEAYWKGALRPILSLQLPIV